MIKVPNNVFEIIAAYQYATLRMLKVSGNKKI